METVEELELLRTDLDYFENKRLELFSGLTNGMDNFKVREHSEYQIETMLKYIKTRMNELQKIQKQSLSLSTHPREQLNSYNQVERTLKPETQTFQTPTFDKNQQLINCITVKSEDESHDVDVDSGRVSELASPTIKLVNMIINRKRPLTHISNQIQFLPPPPKKNKSKNDLIEENLADLEVIKLPKKTENERQLYKCPLCPKIYKKASHVKSHWLQHTNEKKYACNFTGCTKSFYRNYELTRHKKTHLIANSKTQCITNVLKRFPFLAASTPTNQESM